MFVEGLNKHAHSSDECCMISTVYGDGMNWRALPVQSSAILLLSYWGI